MKKCQSLDILMNREDVRKTVLEEMIQVIVNGKIEEALNLAKQAINLAIDPLKAVEAFTQGIQIVGDSFYQGQIFLPELIICGEAMKAGINILDAEIVKRGEMRKYLGKIVIGTVKDDMHDIGKNIVSSLMSANGFKVFDLGIDVSTESFINKIKEVECNIVALSALTTTTMPNQSEIIKAIINEGLRAKVKIIIGGAPTSQIWADKIGADGYGENAIQAVKLAKKICKEIKI
jgi:corrinoid protein of di/trimethylamine methyltransferase